MKKIVILTLLSLSIIISGCSKEPLITEEYSIMQVYMDEKLIYKTKDQEEIDDAIHQINTESRETTYEMSLPEPDGKIIFKNNQESLTVHLYESGSITINEYLVKTSFDFFNK